MDRDLVDLCNALENAFSAESHKTREQEEQSLAARVFASLPFTQFRPGEEREKFFRASAFLAIVERCEALGVGVCGLEVFTTEWQLLAIEVSPIENDRGATWCRDVLERWRAEDALFSATYLIAPELLRGDKWDHLALYRPGTGTMWILKNSGGTFTPVYAEGAPGLGIGGYDLGNSADRAFPLRFRQ
jgi:hypothetical protein